jgi:hypothetical protein
MYATQAKVRLQVEELERRDAPSVLTITPPMGPAIPAATTVAAQGCTSGITAHATTPSSGVVACT